MINNKCLTCGCEIAPSEGMPTPHTGRYNHIHESQCWRNLVETRDRLEKENQALRHGYARMWFAYVNGDREIPHQFEEGIEEEATQLLGDWTKVMMKEMKNE